MFYLFCIYVIFLLLIIINYLLVVYYYYAIDMLFCKIVITYIKKKLLNNQLVN